MKRNTDLLPLSNLFAETLCETDFARRRAYDWRAALLLIQQGVTDFATVNEKDFRDCGFKRVWNPLAAE
jgi:hypothetical protein